jgi:signal peptidase II
MIALASMLAAAIVIAVDQASKGLVMAQVPPVAAAPRGFVSIRRMLNRRGALAPWVGKHGLAALWAAMVGIAALTLGVAEPGSGMLAPIGIGIALGGATGNLVDRLRHDAVVDFIAIGPWPVFNVADAALVAGVGLVVLAAW